MFDISRDAQFLMIYVSILGIQFHPANGKMIDMDTVDETIRRCYLAAAKAMILFEQGGAPCSPV